MFYKISKKRSIFFLVLLILLVSFTKVLANERLEKKYEKWKIAIKNPADCSKVFCFFYNNPHWPLFEESVKIAEKNINSKVSDSVVMKWFKRYPPKTSDGLIFYTKRLLKIDPKFAKTYIGQTWIFQNLSNNFIKKYRSEFREYITPIDDAAKSKRLIETMRMDQLSILKPLVLPDISNYISRFLKKYFLAKSNKYSAADLKDVDKRYGIIQSLIDKKKDKIAANLLSLSNENEEKYASSFFNQRRHVAFNILRSGDPKLAYKVMSMYKVNASGKDTRIAKAEWLLGYISYRFLGNNKNAITHFNKAYENSVDSIRFSKNAFWLAEVYRNKEDILFALDWYKKAKRHFSTFYGYLANERLKILSAGKFRISDNLVYGTKENLALGNAEIIFYNRELVQVLKSTKDRSMTKYFYKRLAEEIDDPDEEVLLMDLALANEEISVLISEFSKKQHYFPNEKAYKVLGQPDMEHVLKINDSDCFKSFVHSIIQRESNFNQNARSHVGAVGIMQIMPSTAKYEEQKLKFYVGNLSLFDKQKNITIGASILNRLLKKYKGNMIYAAAAYNCGEGGVSKYQKNIRSLKNLTSLDLIELIPYKETRLYVKQVLRSMFSYQKKFFAGKCYNCNSIVIEK
ncbi:MAG: lytic transglycosylase domain-containing protein [Holosporales bacterium]|jgi:soluble lytic murein transglycosylase|nr:lytic transglycosylase domain-containing protein [Holosporales bacterium]